ncbi:obscurin-like [Mercenaria mercenaria]|uniref:obscurin-like n=1 Tax=Mercenaria mercenaria TaxID=6596 RepID=UPI00234F6F9E|nr:obscurin-like [Mercenaria mercenaria]
MIYCFKSESISVDFELINKMKQTNDASLHVQMAIQDKFIAIIHGEKDGTVSEKEKKVPQHYDNPVFTVNLQDTFVYVDEPAILTCKLDGSEKEVVWQQDSQPVEETDDLMFVNKKCIHWLAISHAKITDTGFYSCICGQSSTTAFLKVSEKPLKIIENLHVVTAEINVRVNADIILTCTVDQHSNNSVWRHNGKEIKPCDRLCVSVQELEHKLTIHNATLEDEGDYTVDYGDVKSSTTLTLKENPVFTKKLQDTFVYVGEPAIITCKLNVSDKAVIWRHDYKPVEATDNLKLVADKCTHWLAISNTKLTDAGYYSCVCGIESTKASLIVSERPLMITEELHVTTAEADVRENMDIVLMCSINLHTNEVIWKHDGTEITQCIRRQVTVHGLEHKLTIRNAKFEDDGDYTVAFGEKKSSTNLIIKGNLNLLHKKQLTEDLFKNWIRGALGIKYLKQGIQEFAENSVQSHHYEIKKQLPPVVCENCTEDVLLPSHTQGQCPKKSKCLCSKQRKNRRVCQSQGFCSTFYDKILFDHRFFDLTLTNTDIPSWGTDPWSVATCYISTTGYRGKPSANEIDCSGLLSMLINNTFIHRILGDVEINGETDLFKQAKDARNDILHNANYELSEGQLQCYIDLFKDVLEMKDAKGGYPLSRQPGAQDAISNLNEVVARILLLDRY